MLLEPSGALRLESQGRRKLWRPLDTSRWKEVVVLVLSMIELLLPSP